VLRVKRRVVVVEVPAQTNILNNMTSMHAQYTIRIGGQFSKTGWLDQSSAGMALIELNLMLAGLGTP